MKTISTQFARVLSLLALPILSQAGPPAGVGAAEVTLDGDRPCFGAFVDVGGLSTPILPGGEGLVFVALEDSVVIQSNDRNGNLSLRCHGRYPLGGTVMGFDFVTGDPVLASLPTLDGACQALELVFPEACRGAGAAVFNFDTTGTTCTIAGNPAPLWHQVTTNTGVTNLSCHVLP